MGPNRSYGGPRYGSSNGGRVYGAPNGGARVYGSSRGVVGSSRSYSYGGQRSYSYGASRVYGAGARRGVVVGRGGGRYVGSRGFGSRVGYAPYRFYRPYYSFRPRISLGLGLFVGYPIAYPYSYGYYDPYYYPSYSYPYPSYDYAYPSASYPAYPQAGYPEAYPSSTYPQPSYPPAAGTVGVQPGQPANDTGGVSFEITPSTAELFVDGEFIGTVGDFTPTSQPLGLTPGRHRIEIRAPGYQTMNIQTDIIAGQVIPYQGTLQR